MAIETGYKLRRVTSKTVPRPTRTLRSLAAQAVRTPFWAVRKADVAATAPTTVIGPIKGAPTAFLGLANRRFLVPVFSSSARTASAPLLVQATCGASLIAPTSPVSGLSQALAACPAVPAENARDANAPNAAWHAATSLSGSGGLVLTIAA